MTRCSSTLILAGVLATSCSKPNPLFLDTWGGVSEGSTSIGSSDASGLTQDPTTSTTATTLTTTTATSLTSTTSTSDVSSTSGPTATSDNTTGEPFFCDAEPGECCEVVVHADQDTFFSDAIDGAMPEGCPLVDNPDPNNASLKCEKWSFGGVPKLKVFNDYEGGVWEESILNRSMMALHFPMKDGQVVSAGQPIPWEVVQQVTLTLPVAINWDVFDDFAFGLYGLPAGQEWLEGDGPLPCAEGRADYVCRACGVDPDDCVDNWVMDSPAVDFIDMFPGAQGVDETWLEIPFESKYWSNLSAAPSGLVIVPQTVTINGSPVSQFPSGAMTALARESGIGPALRLKVCMQ